MFEVCNGDLRNWGGVFLKIYFFLCSGIFFFIVYIMGFFVVIEYGYEVFWGFNKMILNNFDIFYCEINISLVSYIEE